MSTFTLILETRMKHESLFVNLVQNILCTEGRREKEVFFLSTFKDLSCTKSHEERPFQVMFVGTQQQKKQKKPNTSKRKGQDTTKITPAPAESCIQFILLVMPISMTTLTWMVRNIPNQTTIKEFTEETDEARFVRLCLCLALMNLLHGVALPSSSFETMAIFIPHWVVNSDRLSPEEDRLREDY